MSIVVEVLEKENPVNTPPYPFEFYMLDKTQMDLISQMVILDIHSEASTVVHESLAISNPFRVAEEKKDKAGKYSDDEQAISNFSEQLQREEIKINSEIKKLLSELGTARPQSFSLSDLESAKGCSMDPPNPGEGFPGHVWKMFDEGL
ncbi:hypothetical protein FRX31_003704, partial [Thalictrum thalictroides]